ncbi:MAG TPA: hypothetical protein VN370_02855 [Desulfitobacteriaceae bacterium]|jgi:hypothetical protein|nr:hypothetical protein [Desulfitobacteriaceae bacterium]
MKFDVKKLIANVFGTAIITTAVAIWLNNRFGIPCWIPFVTVIVPTLLFLNTLPLGLISLIINTIFLAALLLVVFLNNLFGISYWILLPVVGWPAFCFCQYISIISIYTLHEWIGQKVKWYRNIGDIFEENFNLFIFLLIFLITVIATILAKTKFDISYWVCPVIVLIILIHASIIQAVLPWARSVYWAGVYYLTPLYVLALVIYGHFYFSLWFIPLIAIGITYLVLFLLSEGF